MTSCYEDFISSKEEHPWGCVGIISALTTRCCAFQFIGLEVVLSAKCREGERYYFLHHVMTYLFFWKLSYIVRQFLFSKKI